MDESYLAANPRNVDVLVHFMGVKGEPCEIHNIDPDKFGVYCAIDNINSFVEDLSLPPCHPFIMWFRCRNGNYKLLNEDKDLVSMFAENENCCYIHLYVTSNKYKFWHEP